MLGVCDMDFLVDGPKSAKRTFLFAHGAGGAMDTPWMTRVARGLAEHGIRVVRFEFPYMAKRRTGGKRGAPDIPLLDTLPGGLRLGLRLNPAARRALDGAQPSA